MRRYLLVETPIRMHSIDVGVDRSVIEITRTVATRAQDALARTEISKGRCVTSKRITLHWSFSNKVPGSR